MPAYGAITYGGGPYAGSRVTGGNPFNNSFPQLIVEIGFGSNALAEPVTWTDVTQYVRQAKTHRGRQHELGRFEAGTANLVLSNRDGRFSSWNTSGAYYPNVVPFVPVRIRASWNGIVYPVFRGYIESWPLKWADAANADVTVGAVDATKVLNLKKPTSLSTYAATVLADTPTRYWTFGDAPGLGVALDSSGNGATATVVNNGTSAPSDKPAQFGAAGALIGSPDTAFDCGNAKGMICKGVQDQSFGTSFTVEAWVNLRQATGQIFVGRNASKTFSVSVNDGSNASTVAGTVHVSSDNSVNIPTVDGLIPVADGKWHHIVIVSTAATSITIFVDGAQDQSNVTANTLGASSLSVGWGGSPNIFNEGGTPSLNGVIDEAAAYYSTALTSTQIANHYVAGALARQTELSGTRISALLSSVGWPATLQTLDAGNSQLSALTTNVLTNTVLATAQTISDTEGGQLFMSAAGSIMFYDRFHTSKSPNGQAAVVLGDSGTTGPGGESPYLVDTVDIEYDDIDLWNETIVTPTGLGPQLYGDTGSQTTYGKRSRSLGTVDYSTTVALGHAQADTNRYKTPLQRVRAVSFTPYSDPDVLFPAALGFELLTRITFKRRPKDGASSTFSQDSLIEGVAHDITPGSWTTTWALSPTDASPVFWIIDDPVAGKIVDGASQSPPVAIGY